MTTEPAGPGPARPDAARPAAPGAPTVPPGGSRRRLRVGHYAVLAVCAAVVAALVALI